MALTDLVESSELKARLNLVITERPSLAGIPVVVPPGRGNAGRVGTAFDYAFRFEATRRFPHAKARRWVAVSASDVLRELESRHRDEKGEAERAALKMLGLLAQVAEATVSEAERFVKRYTTMSKPRIADLRKLAAYSLRLARLDILGRGISFESDFVNVDPAERDDVVDLLRAIPWEAFGEPESLLLNPTFGTLSAQVGGADADVVWGSMLLELKTGIDPTEHNAALRQTLGYLLLARAARAAGEDFPEVRRVGVYCARHAHLWSAPVAVFEAHPAFSELESSFVRHVSEVSEPRHQGSSSDRKSKIPF